MPAAMLGTTKSPVALVTTGAISVPCASLISVTVAPGTTPPCASLTVPDTVPVTPCANAATDEVERISSAHAARRSSDERRHMVADGAQLLAALTDIGPPGGLYANRVASYETRHHSTELEENRGCNGAVTVKASTANSRLPTSKESRSHLPDEGRSPSSWLNRFHPAVSDADLFGVGSWKLRVGASQSVATAWRRFSRAGA